MREVIRPYRCLSPIALLLLSACAGTLPESPDPSEESRYIELEEPIVLDLKVLPMQVVYPTGGSGGRSATRANQAFAPSYTEFTMPTVNTEKLEVNVYSKEVFGEVDVPEVFFEENLTGYDHIKSLSISELRPEDYRVEGLVETTGLNQFDPDMPGDFPNTPTDLPDKVTVTLYRLPKSGTLTFLANARVFETRKRVNAVVDLTSERPYFLVGNNRCQVSPSMSEEYAELRYTDKTFYVDYSGIYNALRYAYVPMYGRLYNVRRDPSAPHKLLASQTKDGAVSEVSQVLLERAVSFVSVCYNLQSVLAGRDENGGAYQFYDGDYLIERCLLGMRCSIGSIVPDNWEGIKKQTSLHFAKFIAPRGTPIPLYEYLGSIVSSDDYSNVPLTPEIVSHRASANVLGGTKLVGENYPTTKEDQNTLHLEVTKFKGHVDPKTSKFSYAAIGKRGQYVYHVPYGELNEKTGLMEIHRNTLYVIVIDLKRLVRARATFSIDQWKDDSEEKIIKVVISE